MKRLSLPAADVPRETRERLAAFRDMLLRWNARINLVADRDPVAIDRRHIEDSLQLLPLLPPDGPMADLGSGAGFPGLVIALASEREAHLIESDRRKAAFLQEAARTLGLPNVIVHAQRIEDIALPPLTAVTARALAPLHSLLPHAARLLAPSGIALFPKGRNAESELTDALHDWRMRVERFQSRTDPAATVFRLSEIRRAGA